MRLSSNALCSLLAALTASATAQAATGGAPLTVRWSGRLLDGMDAPVTRSAVPFTFRIVDAALAGTVEWQASCALDVRGGYVAPLLGAGGCAGDGLDTSDLAGDRWLEVSVDGVALSPRMALAPVPRAALADRALVADLATNATNAVNAQNAVLAQNAVNATNAVNAQSASTAVTAQNAVNATNAVNAQSATTAATAQNADKLGGVAATDYARTTALATGGGASIHVGNLSGGPLPSPLLQGNYDQAVQLTHPGSVYNGTFNGTFNGNFAGGIKIPVDTGRTTCTVADKGALYLNDADGQVHVCNGAVWRRISTRPPELLWESPAPALGNFLATATVTVKLSNPGDSAVNSLLLSPTVTLGTASVSLSSNTCTGTLAAGATCTAQLTVTAPNGGGVSVSVAATASNAQSASTTVVGTGEVAASCKALRAAGVPTSGTYRLDADGSGSAAPFDTYCDMTTSAQGATGGWTLVGIVSQGDANRWGHNYPSYSQNAWESATAEFGAPTPGVNADYRSRGWSLVSGREVMISYKNQFLMRTDENCLANRPLGTHIASLGWDATGSQDFSASPAQTHPCTIVQVTQRSGETTLVGGSSPSKLYWKAGEAEGVQESNKDRSYLSTNIRTNVDMPWGLGAFNAGACSAPNCESDIGGVNNDAAPPAPSTDFYEIYVR